MKKKLGWKKWGFVLLEIFSRSPWMMLGWKHEIKVLLLNQHLWLWAPGISKIIASPENPHELQQTTRKFSVVFRHLPSPMFAFCCRDMASPRSFYAIDDAISEKTRQAAAASMNFSQKSSWSMWKKTLKWGKSIAIIYVYIYIYHLHIIYTAPC